MASTKPAAKTATAKAAADTTAAADAKAAEAKAQSAKPAAKAPVKKPGLIVSTRKGVKSFRRAGLAFTEAETTIAADTLKAEQIEALKSEPMLTVRELDDISDSE